MKGRIQDLCVASLKLSTTFSRATRRSRFVPPGRIIDPADKPQIYLAGDSAGGGLIITSLFSARHPMPNVPKLELPSSAKFPKALLICPGNANPSSAPSMTDNDGKDIFTKAMMEGMFQGLKAATEPDADLSAPWFTFTKAPEDWWSNLPVRDVTILVGDNEMLRDDILTIGKSWKVRSPCIWLTNKSLIATEPTSRRKRQCCESAGTETLPFLDGYDHGWRTRTNAVGDDQMVGVCLDEISTWKKIMQRALSPSFSNLSSPRDSPKAHSLFETQVEAST